jgi:trimeric autotransporter adhesin
VAPALTPITDQNVIAGTALNVSVSYDDPGVLDTQTVVIDWGDGVTETIDLDAGLNSFDISHAYAELGDYTVTVTLTDEDGGVDVVTFSVSVDASGYRRFLPVITR